VGAALAGGCGSTSNDPNSAPSTRTDAIVIAEGRQWAHKFYEGDTEALWNQFTLDKQSSLKSKQSLDDWHDLFEGTRGVESQVLDEQVERTSQLATYVRFATFEYSGTRRAIRIGFDESGKIGVFNITAAEPEKEAPTSYLDYATHTALRLPFDGHWNVMWGGRTIDQNQHASVRDQRFAYDIAIVENGKTYRTTGKENADYLCFGQPVLAPGAGTVVGVGDGVEDNAPGQTPTGEFSIRLLGNHVIIDHGESEFSFIIHLMNGSTQVKVGDRVDAGAPVGLCGNSGSATEPHLHYHLQNTGVFAHGDGLPAQFRNYTSNGTFVESGEPVRQERVINGRE
jgi:murein DD-endopeptidase MepM/ murein hydrolase activator NlpD